jgi:hypothetical protein
MTEKYGETFDLCMKHLEAKDAGVTGKPSKMNPGMPQIVLMLVKTAYNYCWPKITKVFDCVAYQARSRVK